MATPLMKLSGEGVGFTFSLATAAWQELARSTAWRWRRAERLGAAPARQYVGPGDDTIRLRGTVYPAERGAGIRQIDDLRAAAAAGEPLRLTAAPGDGGGRTSAGG